MVKFCMHPHCDNKAIWGLQADNEQHPYNVCTKHRSKAIEGYQKLGHTPKITLLKQ